MNELQARELETFEQDDRFQVTDLNSANWVFKKLDAITTKENEVKELANSEIERINLWRDKEIEKLQSNKEYLQSLVIEYFRIEKEKDKKFKLNTPYGKVTSRKGAKVIQVSNENKVIEQLRENGKQIDVVVIETIQKLRDITIENVMKGKIKKPTFNDWGECASRIVSIYRYISKLQEQYQFHLAISGHEGINKDKDDEGSTINPTITIEAQDQIRKAIISQSDVLARMTIEENEQDGEKSYQYVLNAEPSDLFETKIRHASNITISSKKFVNPSINDVVQAIRNGN